MILGVVSCALVSDPLKPGHLAGYSCVICNKPLQVSKTGKAALDGGAQAMCRDCSTMAMEKLDRNNIPIIAVARGDIERAADRIVKELTVSEVIHEAMEDCKEVLTAVPRGQRLNITFKGKTIPGWIILASPNRRSLVLGFEALIAGHLCMMPVTQEGPPGTYQSLFNDATLTIEWLEGVTADWARGQVVMTNVCFDPAKINNRCQVCFVGLRAEDLGAELIAGGGIPVCYGCAQMIRSETPSEEALVQLGINDVRQLIERLRTRIAAMMQATPPAGAN